MPLSEKDLQEQQPSHNTHRKRKLDNDPSDEFTVHDMEPLRDEEEGLYGDEDEPNGEDEDDNVDEHGKQAKQEIEPSEHNFGTIPFHAICKQLERISSHPVGVKQKLMNLLPPAGIAKLKNVQPGSPPQTPFPIIRLLCPDKDASREYFIKEYTLAKAYIRAFAWENNHVLAQALLRPNDPKKISAAKLPLIIGDITQVIMEVLKGKIPDKPSSLTIADINKMLDELASIKHRGNLQPTNHDWESSTAATKRQKREFFERTGVLQGKWIKSLLSGKHRLSPLEHKWLARMILKDMKISLGFDKILFWFDPLAPSLWSGHNSLRGLCKIICQPDFHGKAITVASQNNQGNETQALAPYLTKSAAQIQLGVPFTPMFSHRTGFDRMLFDLSFKHRTYLKDPVFGKLEEKTSLKLTSCMVMEHPAFAIETKLDGERLLVHLSRDGLVKIHTRQSNWYSDVYSPAVGPKIRQAFGHHKMDMILDGEIIAWDNEKEETIPFGNNRTVARFRAEWMKHQGLLDTRDRNLHGEEQDVKVINLANLWNDSEGVVPDLNGRDCWLQFIAFDIVFLDGEGAQAILDKVVSPVARARPGSLMDLECMERKKILYHVTRTVPKFVEVVPTLVVSSDGDTHLGSQYFSLTNPPKFMGRPLFQLDSPAIFIQEISDPKKARKRQLLEDQRRQGLTNQEIGEKRAAAVSRHYSRIVDDQRQEGLIFKDLSTPYVLDKVSRSLGYWRKFKPDYFNGSVASDIDLVIIGAYFASGLRGSGTPSSYLCACTNDLEDEDKYVPLCKVSAFSIGMKENRRILYDTKYKTPTETTPLDTGKWFSYGDSRTEFPDFVSSFSFASDTPTMSGWKPKKEDYPDLWINPEDSVVLTLNAGEIVPSTAFPSRVTLRFPRITKIRTDKRAREVESLQMLWEMYDKVLSDRAGDNSERGFESQPNQFADSATSNSRFWTEEKYVSEGKNKRKTRPKTLHSVAAAAAAVPVESAALKDAVFVPLEGTYRLKRDSLEAMEGQEGGWLEEAKSIRDFGGIRAFIKKHGGKVMLAPDAKLINEGAIVIGGEKDDPRVVNFIHLIEMAQTKVPELQMKKSKRTAKDESTLIFAKCGGVVRWTFILSALRQWQNLEESIDCRRPKTIREFRPNLLTPDPLDYLARPKSQREEDFIEDLCRVHVEDATKMRRLLNELAAAATATTSDEMSETDSASGETWREVCKSSFDPGDRWIMRCQKQVLWPYEEDKVHFEDTIVYVDLFDDPFTNKNQLSTVDTYTHASILSVVPLLRVAGAYVTTRLGARVTHVLCELGEDERKIAFSKAKAEHFGDIQCGNRLIGHVKGSSLYPDSPPHLISPLWVRENMWNQQTME